MLLSFAKILANICRKYFWKFHGSPLNLQITLSMNFRGCRKKTQPQNGSWSGCPPPSRRWGFGGRRATLPWRGWREKRLGRTQERMRLASSWECRTSYLAPCAGLIGALSRSWFFSEAFVRVWHFDISDCFFISTNHWNKTHFQWSMRSRENHRNSKI